MGNCEGFCRSLYNNVYSGDEYMVCHLLQCKNCRVPDPNRRRLDSHSLQSCCETPPCVLLWILYLCLLVGGLENSIERKSFEEHQLNRVSIWLCVSVLHTAGRRSVRAWYFMSCVVLSHRQPHVEQDPNWTGSWLTQCPECVDKISSLPAGSQQ